MLEITAEELLEHSVIRAEIEAAWSDAGFGTPQAHEEGGWIYRSSGRHARPTYLVKRWPSGPTCSTATGCGITPQSPAEIPGFVLVAEFHVHPMPEKNEHGKSTGFAAEPSSADLKAAQDLELLGIVRNQFGYDPYNGYGCGPDDGCTGGGEMLAVGGPGEGATDAAALAQGTAEADRASSYRATGTGAGSGISRPTLDR